MEPKGLFLSLTISRVYLSAFGLAVALPSSLFLPFGMGVSILYLAHPGVLTVCNFWFDRLRQEYCDCLRMNLTHS